MTHLVTLLTLVASLIDILGTVQAATTPKRYANEDAYIDRTPNGFEVKRQTVRNNYDMMSDSISHLIDSYNDLPASMALARTNNASMNATKLDVKVKKIVQHYNKFNGSQMASVV